jgi:hypothetical protein
MNEMQTEGLRGQQQQRIESDRRGREREREREKGDRERGLLAAITRHTRKYTLCTTLTHIYAIGGHADMFRKCQGRFVFRKGMQSVG